MSVNAESQTLLIPAAAMEQSRPAVSVVIVVWNAKKYVMECLTSLREHCASVYDEVIVVDNASTDGTPDLVAELFPEFKLIRNASNLGFAQANNIGIAQSSGEYVCLVNSDVKFNDDCLSPMLQFMSQHLDAGMVGPTMLSDDGEVRRSTMRFPTVWNEFCRALGLDLVFKKSRLFGGLLMSDFDHQTTAPVEILNGWFVVVRRRALNRVGQLDPEFFMYAEDLDWSYRFHKAGEKLFFFADAGAIHYGGASSSNAPLRFYLEMSRANCQYWRKHHGRIGEMAFLANSAIYHLVRFVGSAGMYLLSPSHRAENGVRLHRSSVCLKWLRQPAGNPADARG